MEWINEFERRMGDFESSVAGRPDQFPVSIKVRVDSGCYDRGCCPAAHEIIDREIDTLRRLGQNQFRYIKHESGPEILAYAGAAMGLAASVIGLVTVIIQASTEGRKKGDRHNDPVTLVVRRIEAADKLLEERVMTFTGHEKVTPDMIEALLRAFDSEEIRALITSYYPLAVKVTSHQAMVVVFEIARKHVTDHRMLTAQPQDTSKCFAAPKATVDWNCHCCLLKI